MVARLQHIGKSEMDDPQKSPKSPKSAISGRHRDGTLHLGGWHETHAPIVALLALAMGTGAAMVIS
jgi:hypothetical protein